MLTKEYVTALRAIIIDSEQAVTLEDIASAIEYELADRAKRDSEYQALQDIGKSAAESIAEMVAALECDYERLEELRDLRLPGPVDVDNPDDKSNDELFAELADLEKAAGECESREDAEQRIYEDPLSVEVRGDWVPFGTEPVDAAKPVEFVILLGTGGPATRIIGELDEHGEPTRARIQAQDWFKPWTDYTGDAISQDDLLTYCRCFYFGE